MKKKDKIIIERPICFNINNLIIIDFSKKYFVFSSCNFAVYQIEFNYD